jgi:hypothetical protein
MTPLAVRTPYFVPGLNDESELAPVFRRRPTLEERLLDMGFTPLQIAVCLLEPAEFAKRPRPA